MNLNHGFLCAVEGIDGAGKSTLCRNLVRHLSDLGLPVKQLIFPSNSGFLSIMLSKYLSGFLPLNPYVAQLLFAADRYQFREDIKALVEQGYIVICDRYIFSAFAYGLARDLHVDWMELVESELPQPDIVLYLDIDTEDALVRLAQRAEKQEPNVCFFLTKVKSSYLNLASRYSYIWHVVNASNSPTTVQSDCAAVLLRLYSDKGR